MTELYYMHSSSKKMLEFPPWAERSTTELWHASHETSLVKQLFAQTRFPLKLQRTVAPSRVGFWWCLACQLLPSALAEAAFLSKTHSSSSRRGLLYQRLQPLPFPSLVSAISLRFSHFIFCHEAVKNAEQLCGSCSKSSVTHTKQFLLLSIIGCTCDAKCVCVFYVSHSSWTSLNVQHPPPTPLPPGVSLMWMTRCSCKKSHIMVMGLA